MNIDPLLFSVVDLLLKSLAILTLVFTVQHVWRKASAASLNIIWLMAFGALFLLPLTRLVQPRWTTSLAEKKTIQLQALPMYVPVVQVGHGFEEMKASPASATLTLPDTRQILLGIWMTGAALVMARRMMGVWQLRRIKRQSVSLLQTSTGELASRLAQQWGVRRSVELCESKEVPVPLTWGTLRPVLMLPYGATQWSEERLLAALQHELGHIKRFDVLTRGLMDLVCALYWINPLVWLGAKAMRLTQERACDDLVMNAGVSAEGYATQLLESARFAQTRFNHRLPALAMAQPSTLETRLLAIVDEQQNRGPISRLTRLFASSAAIALLLLSATLQLRAEEEKKTADSVKSTQQILADKIIMPSMVFDEATLEEAVDFLRIQSREYDAEKKGINFVIQAPKAALNSKLSLSLKDVSLSKALNHIVQLTNMMAVFEESACVIKPIGTPATAFQTNTASTALASKAERIIIPHMEFVEATVSEALEFLNVMSRKYDPEKKGVNLILNRSKAWDEKAGAEPTLSLSLKEVPLSEALRYVVELTNMKLSVDQDAYMISPTVGP